MIAFLTSSPGGYYEEYGVRKPYKFDERNGFLDKLTDVWKDNSRILLICAEPDNIEENNNMRDNFVDAFRLSGLSAAEIEICDGRNGDKLPELIKNRDVVILSGGHTLTQNIFYKEIGLKPLIHKFDGIIIGVSGGTMNSGTEVYAQPELDGEVTDPEYVRFTDGLGLMDYMILPHYNVLKDKYLDGKHLIKEVAIEDSYGRKIYAIPDGSYVLIKDGKAEIIGEAYLIADGKITEYRQER